MAAQETQRPVSQTRLRHLEIDEPIYQGTDSKDQLLFRPHLSVCALAESTVLPKRCLLALGLTEICSRKMIGKVYFLAMADSIAPPRTGPNQTTHLQALTMEGFLACERLPELIYVPFVWSDSDKMIWNSINHEDRCQMLNARAGGLRLEDVVMPVEMTYEAVARETFQLNGLIGAQSGSKAMLAIMPKAYLGWYSELQKGTLTEYGARQTQGAYYTVDHDMIKRTQCRTGEILVDKLLTMFESPIEGAVIKYRQIVETLIEVFKQMERFGSADE